MQNDKLKIGPDQNAKWMLSSGTYSFALTTVTLCHRLAQGPDSGRVLGTQLLRSGTSIGANVEEAQAGQSKADFACKIMIALKEARETRYWLRLINDSKSHRA
jgi:four helix bundle protein